MSPFDLINATADVYTIPLNECGLDWQQHQLIEEFHAATGQRWTIEIVRADSATMWMVSNGVSVIVDMSLSTALRKAREER
jgi:hypothetical protein